MKIFPLIPVSLETLCFEMIKKILPEHEFLPSQALFGQSEELFKLKGNIHNNTWLVISCSLINHKVIPIWICSILIGNCVVICAYK